MSFAAVTKVLLAGGAAVPISQLKPGEKVLATNTRTGKTQAETVTAVLLHHDTDLYDLKIRDHGKTAVIDTTSNHLFRVPATSSDGGRWVKAGAQKYGTHLRTPTGSNTVTWPQTPGPGKPGFPPSRAMCEWGAGRGSLPVLLRPQAWQHLAV